MLNLYQLELASTALPPYPRGASLCLEYSNSSHLVNIYSSLKIQLQYHTLLEAVNTVLLLLFDRRELLYASSYSNEYDLLHSTQWIYLLDSKWMAYLTKDFTED